MAGECGKLCRRDRTYLLCLAGVIALALLYGMTGCYKMIELQRMPVNSMNEAVYRAQSDMVWTLWGGEYEVDCYFNTLRFIFWIAVVAQLAKWHILEGRRGRELQRLFPVKNSSYVTYDFLCGILLIWLPTALSWIVFSGWIEGLRDPESWDQIAAGVWSLTVTNSFLYVLFVFTKRITNHIFGTLFSAFVIWFGLYWEFSVLYPTAAAISDETAGMATLLILTLLGIPASYLCDKKRDIAGNGVFYFMPVHYLILGMFFFEMIYMIGTFVERDFMKMAGGVLLAGAVSFGIHYIAKPKIQ